MNDRLPNICPKCGSPTTLGYGLAGGGIGAYTACDNDECDFFDKVQDEEVCEDNHKVLQEIQNGKQEREERG